MALITLSNPTRKKLTGATLVLLAWIFFTSVIALSRTASAKSSVPTVLFFQNFVGMILILPWVIKGEKKGLQLSKIGLVVLRSLAGYINYAFVFLAVKRIPLVNVVLLSNAAPLFIPLIIWLWKRVHLSKGLWTGVIIGFVGIAIILRPTEEIINIGALFALGAAICLSISMIVQRRLAKSHPVQLILFYYFLIGSILSLPFSFETWGALDGSTLLLLLGIGVLFATGQMLFAASFKYEKPSFLSSFNYSAVVYGVLIEWFFWGHLPSWITIAGILVVCTGGIITITKGQEITSDKKDL